MAWHTEYLRDDTRALAQIEAEYPYLTAVLSARPEDAGLVRERFNNYRQARLAERGQPLVVENLPYHVVLDPSNVCNLACPLCVQATDPHGRARRMIDIEDYARLLDQLAGCVIRLDLFNWGEPLLHPHFADLVELASARSIYTRTSSHFSHKQGVKAERLVESGLRYIVASIDGATNSTFERYRVNGNLSYVLRNLEDLVSARARAGSVYPLIEWQYLVMEHNVDEIAQARDLAKQLGVDVFRYGGARGRMSTKILTDSPTNVGQSQGLLLNPVHPLSEYDENGEKRRVQEKSRCFWLWGKVALHPDGGVSPCWSNWFQEKDYGNWLNGNLQDVWNGEAYQRARHTACHGGQAATDAALVCDTCAFNKSFVPTPDGDQEPLPDLHHLSRVVGMMTEVGLPPSVEIVRALRDEVAHAA
jgi:MoaA/NifB/PqqE/SkfB family radical SAM enzyme